MRVLFALPGLHRVNRGAEVAFQEVARWLTRIPGCTVTLLGSGEPRAGEPYQFKRARAIFRGHFEWCPSIPGLRTHFAYEELTFLPGLLAHYRPRDYDVTVACSYPYVNWALRGWRRKGCPRHVFVTQNGDWMAYKRGAEYRYFGCDGLICTNPEYYENHRRAWPSVLIPNGVNPDVFSPGAPARERLGLPLDRPVVLMVSALEPIKRVIEGIRAVTRVPEAHLVIAGDGELRSQVEQLGAELLPGRMTRRQFSRHDMPDVYRSADVLLHMNQNEPSANAYIEALSVGLPIVTHDCPVTRWTLEDQAVLLDSSDLDATADGIRRAFQQRSPRQVSNRRELVSRRFAWSQIAERYHGFFRQLCNEEAPVTKPTRTTVVIPATEAAPTRA